ncbi:MAG: HAD hydrolase-like protein [Candidatus Nealsonbacteria bacterium]|nr:HAD hydrolase-like protein [Candidatus Nealsonbacteria bacterium]
MSMKLTYATTIPITDVAARHPQPLPGRITGVLLDACNVLYDDTVWRRWMLQLLSRLGLHTNYRCFFRVWDREFLDDVHCRRRDFDDAISAFLLSVGLSRGQIDEVLASCIGRRRQLQAAARPLPGVRATLARLYRSGIVLGAVCNSEHPGDEMQRRLQRMVGGPVFSTVVSSFDLGRTMPDERCYLTALAAMGRPVEQVAFVGHDAGELAGAAQLGMPTIALNHDPEAQAHTYLDRFDDLIDVVKVPASLVAAG